MKLKTYITIISTTGALFVILLAFVFAYQWPELLRKYPVPSTPVAQGEIDTSEWLTFKDPNERYTLLYPPFFHDLAPLGYHTTDFVHSFGPSLVPSPKTTALEDLEIQGITLSISFSTKAESPMTDPEYLKRRHAWYEKKTLTALDGNTYIYVAYGDISYEGENGYALTAIRTLPNEKETIAIQLFSFSKDEIIRHRGEFESIVTHFKLL